MSKTPFHRETLLFIRDEQDLWRKDVLASPQGSSTAQTWATNRNMEHDTLTVSTLNVKDANTDLCYLINFLNLASGY